ncbi:MAG TPA: hypothetical protein VJX67_23680, partial [Blastocatellia bacterium]|nr:hypothetical protein [Blastocatellia bacterium]
ISITSIDGAERRQQATTTGHLAVALADRDAGPLAPAHRDSRCWTAARDLCLYSRVVIGFCVAKYLNQNIEKM